MAKSKYQDDFPERVYWFARDDLTNKSIAEKLGITQETFYQYLKKYSEFSDSLKKGREDSYAARTPKVIDALYKRATGFIGPNDKYYPPSDTALIFYLVNRSDGEYRSINRDNGGDGGTQTVKFKFNVVGDES